jgi:hypothetical protein
LPASVEGATFTALILCRLRFKSAIQSSSRSRSRRASSLRP